MTVAKKGNCMKKMFSITISLLLTTQYANLVSEAEVSMAQPSSQDQVEAQQLLQQAKLGSTQSEAHLTRRWVRVDLVNEAGIARHKKIIDQALERERKYKDKYLVFYTSIPYMRLFQDVTRKLYRRVEGKAGALKDKAFQFIRYTFKDPTYSQYKNVTQFLLDEIEKNGMVDDNDVRLKTILVSTSLAFFSNIGQPGESAYSYFNNPQAWASLNPDWLKKSIRSFGYPEEYTDQLIDLAKTIITDTGDLFQIFIPKTEANNIGYVSWRQGIPFDPQFLKWLFEREEMTYSRKDKLFHAEINEKLKKLKKNWLARDPETVKMVEYMLDNVKNGKYLISPFLTKFVNEPEKIEFPINFAQARLLVTNDYLLNPKSGILIFRYVTLDPIREELYKQRLRNIIQQMEVNKQKQLGKITQTQQQEFKDRMATLQAQRKAIRQEIGSKKYQRLPSSKKRQYMKRLSQLLQQQQQLFKTMQEEGIPIDEFSLTQPGNP